MDSALATAQSGRPEGRPGWKLLAEVVRVQRLGISLGVCAGVLWTTGKVAVPMLVRQAIDHGISRGSSTAAVHWALLVGLAGVVAATFTGLRRYMAFHEGRRAEADLRVRLFAHLQRLQFGFHDRVSTGELMSRSHADLLQVQLLITQIPLTISNFVIVIAVTVIMLSMQPLLTLLALGSLPFVNILGRRFANQLHPAVRGLSEQTAELAGVVEESVAGVRVIKGFGAEGVQQARLEKEADDVYAMAMRAAIVRSVYTPAIELVPSLGLVLVLAYGGQLVLSGAMSLGTLVMFNFYVLLLVNPLRSLGQVISMAERAANAADRAAQVLATEPNIVDAASPAPLPAGREGRGDVRLQNVSFGYAGPDSPRVLQSLDLHIRAGESVAIVGETGCGKSTVAKLIPRFYDVDQGSVQIDGIDVRKLALHELRSQVGIVFEDTFLFSDTVAANIAFADPGARVEQIERAARLAGAHDFILALPEGYATPIGERGFSLSGGQRQRIAIARAILADPRVLILDDATSSVDPEKEHEIRAAMAEVMRGRTTIVIAHRPVTIALADRVVLMSGGRIVAEGKHDVLLRTHAAYRRVLAASSTAEVAS